MHHTYLFPATKVPLLIFSGDIDGSITKWERMQSNHFMYRFVYKSVLTCTCTYFEYSRSNGIFQLNVNVLSPICACMLIWSGLSLHFINMYVHVLVCKPGLHACVDVHVHVGFTHVFCVLQQRIHAPARWQKG